MTGKYVIRVSVSAGLSMTNPAEDPSVLTIGGIPCSQANGCTVTSTSKDSTLVGGKNVSFEITFAQKTGMLPYFQKTGLEAATKKTAATNTTLTAGDHIGIDFNAYMNGTTDTAYLEAVALKWDISHYPRIYVSKSAASSVDFTCDKTTVNVLNSPTSINTSTHPTYYAGQRFYYEITTALPNADDLNNQYYTIRVSPSTGLNVTNAYMESTSMLDNANNTRHFMETITVGGITLYNLMRWSHHSGFQGNGSSNTQDMLIGGNGAYWEIRFTKWQIEYLNKHGVYQGKTGINTGDPFTIVFPAELTNAAKPLGYGTLTTTIGYTTTTATDPDWEPNVPLLTDPSITTPVWLTSETVEPSAQLRLLTSQGYIQIEDPTYVQPDHTYNMILITHCPDPSEMTGPYTDFAITVAAHPGVSISNTSNLSSIKIAGIPLNQLPSVKVTSSQPHQQQLTGSTNASWTIYLTAADITYIEQHGISMPTIASAAGSTPTTIQPGDKIAVSFSGGLNSTYHQTGNEISGSTSYLPSTTSNTPTVTSPGTSLFLTPSPRPFLPTVQTSLLNSSGLVRTNPVSEPANTHFTIQVTFTLPNPDLMTPSKDCTPRDSITINSRTGVIIENANIYYDRLHKIDGQWQKAASDTVKAEGQNITIAGIPLEQFVKDTGSILIGDNTTDLYVPGDLNGTTNTWTLGITQKGIEYLEKYGVTAATTSSPAGTTPGLKPGDKFAITFTGYLNSDATPTNNIVYAQNDFSGEKIPNTDYYPLKSPFDELPISLQTTTTPLPVRQLPFTGGQEKQWFQRAALLIITGLTGLLGWDIIRRYRNKHNTEN